MLDERTQAHLIREIRQIDTLLQKYDDLLNKVRYQEPDLVEITALGSVLHSFYTGVENLFQTIAKRFDGNMPGGSSWHRELLAQMVGKTKKRKNAISPTMRTSLEGYLGFRHVYRHSYSFVLEWEEMEELISDLRDLWSSLKEEIRVNLDLRSTDGD